MRSAIASGTQNDTASVYALLTPATHRSPINWLAIACYAAAPPSCCSCFTRIFLFGKIGALASRTVDDLAFQLALRDAHTSIASGQFSKLWILNYYAYGWLYWAPLAWITYPLYLISSYFGIDWPLIVVPRQVSLLFALGGAYFLRKIVKRFTQNEAICATAALIYLLFPAIAFFHAIRHRHRDFVPVDPERVSAVARQSIIIPGLGACSDSPCRGWGRQAQRAAHRSIPVSDHRQASHRKTCLAHARHSVRVGLIVRRNTDPFD